MCEEEQLDERLVDPYRAVSSAVRFPVPGLSLKEVEAFAGIERESAIRDAQNALVMYHRTLDSDESDSVGLWEALSVYAEDDIVGLGEVVNYLRDLG